MKYPGSIQRALAPKKMVLRAGAARRAKIPRTTIIRDAPVDR